MTMAITLVDYDIVLYSLSLFVAQLCASLILTVSPERISLGGGVLNRRCLYPLIRCEVRRLLNGYVQHDAILSDLGIEAFIGPSIW
jgi:fructokinase